MDFKEPYKPKDLMKMCNHYYDEYMEEGDEGNREVVPALSIEFMKTNFQRAFQTEIARMGQARSKVRIVYLRERKETFEPWIAYYRKIKQPPETDGKGTSILPYQTAFDHCFDDNYRVCKVLTDARKLMDDVKTFLPRWEFLRRAMAIQLHLLKLRSNYPKTFIEKIVACMIQAAKDGRVGVVSLAAQLRNERLLRHLNYRLREAEYLFPSFYESLLLKFPVLNELRLHDLAKKDDQKINFFQPMLQDFE